MRVALCGYFFLFSRSLSLCACMCVRASVCASPCKYHPLCVGTRHRWSGARAPCGHRIPISVCLPALCVRLGGSESVTLLVHVSVRMCVVGVSTYMSFTSWALTLHPYVCINLHPCWGNAPCSVLIHINLWLTWNWLQLSAGHVCACAHVCVCVSVCSLVCI